MMKLQNYRKVYMCKNYSLAILIQYRSFQKTRYLRFYCKKIRQIIKYSKMLNTFAYTYK